jgi:signal transduction histidine kinase
MGFLNLKELSLKMRFIYSFVFVIIITITILSTVNHFRWNRNYLKQVRDEGLILTQTLAQGSMDPIIRNDFYTLNEYVNTLIKKKNIAYIVITDKQDDVLAQSHGALSKIPQPINSHVIGLNRSFLVQTYYNPDFKTRINDISVPVFIDKNKWGAVRVGFSLAYMRAEITKNILVVIVTSLVLVIIGIGVALILSRFVTEPIKKFSRSMETVASGNFEQEVSINTADEFGLLARSFNEMAVSLKKNKLELKKTYQRLMQKEKMAALGEITARIAHEIKNPLGIIKGTAQILVDEKENADIKLEVAGFIIDEVNRLDAKVRDLLNHSRLQPPALRKVDVNDILEETIHIWEFQKSEGRHITIYRNYCQKLPPLMLDREQIRQVILNLLINSREAMPDGGKITVATGLDFQKEAHHNPGNMGGVLIEFEDTGIGIQEKDLSRIFDPFFTTKKDGTGLGLATVNRIVENHKGKISVESKLGAGTRFALHFPINDKA